MKFELERLGINLFHSVFLKKTLFTYKLLTFEFLKASFHKPIKYWFTGATDIFMRFSYMTAVTLIPPPTFTACVQTDKYAWINFKLKKCATCLFGFRRPLSDFGFFFFSCLNYDTSITHMVSLHNMVVIIQSLSSKKHHEPPCTTHAICFVSADKLF